ncbi:MAG: type II toxin-antitoxin system HicA family toxin [Acidobacteria bacterium]|nr:type II toxin-antitoxin system HicA family toxin [Acidobacteriota bacterium]
MVAIFAGFGFAVAGQKGSLAKLRRIGTDGRRQTLVVPLHAEMDKGTLRGLMAQGCRFVRRRSCGRTFTRSERVIEVESRMGASTDAEAPPRFPSPLIKPDVRVSRTLCGAPHKMRWTKPLRGIGWHDLSLVTLAARS